MISYLLFVLITKLTASHQLFLTDEAKLFLFERQFLFLFLLVAHDLESRGIACREVRQDEGLKLEDVLDGVAVDGGYNVADLNSSRLGGGPLDYRRHLDAFAARRHLLNSHA